MEHHNLVAPYVATRENTLEGVAWWLRGTPATLDTYRSIMTKKRIEALRIVSDASPSCEVVAKTHKIWLTSPDSPAMPSIEQLNRVKKMYASLPDQEHMLWCNHHETGRKIADFVRTDGIKVLLKNTTELRGGLEARIARTCLHHRHFAWACYVMRIDVVHRYGGIYSDFGWTLSPRLMKQVAKFDVCINGSYTCDPGCASHNVVYCKRPQDVFTTSLFSDLRFWLMEAEDSKENQGAWREAVSPRNIMAKLALEGNNLKVLVMNQDPREDCDYFYSASHRNGTGGSAISDRTTCAKMLRFLGSKCVPNFEERVEFYLGKASNEKLTLPQGDIDSWRKPGEDWKLTYARWLDEALHKHGFKGAKCYFAPGDIEHTTHSLELVKNRYGGNMSSGVLLRSLAFHRHWGHVYGKSNDPIFKNKVDKVYWRGVSTGAPSNPGNRFSLVEMWFGRRPKKIDIGLSGICQGKESWSKYVKGKVSISKFLEHKYIISAPGNDKDSGLNWKLASNSLVLMTRPRVTSWLMESELIPGYHYVLLKDDYSDLLEKFRWCQRHPERCKQIIKNANHFMSQFLDQEREEKIEKDVLTRYFRALAGLLPPETRGP